MMIRSFRLLSLLILLIAFGSTSFGADEPWSSDQLIQPESLAKTLKQEAKTPRPFIVHVGFPVFFKNGHIPGSVYAGPTNTPAGMDLLRRAVEHLSRDFPIIVYCGCCPLVKCPNVRPAFRELRAMGFKNVSLLNLPDSLGKNWIDKGYPTEK